MQVGPDSPGPGRAGPDPFRLGDGAQPRARGVQRRPCAPAPPEAVRPRAGGTARQQQTWWVDLLFMLVLG